MPTSEISEPLLQALHDALVGQAREWAGSQGLDVPGELPLAAPPSHVKADISLSWALGLAKITKGSPMAIAAALAGRFSRLPEVAEASVSSPGFVNLRLKETALLAEAENALFHAGPYKPRGSKRKILIEFVSANPTGPLHAASGRGATLGDALARILRMLGHEVAMEYYVNDCGRQVDMLGRSLEARRDGKPVPEDGYHGSYLEDLARQLPAQAKTWSATELSRYAVDALLKTHQEDMRAFDVHFDRYFRESELHARKALEATLDRLKSLGAVYEKEGAVWFKRPEEAASAEDDKDRVLVRADGRPTYFLADIAYHEDKYSRGYPELIDIWGADHHGYVPRLKGALEALGRAPAGFHVILHQLIRLMRGNEAVKMSKRAGEFVRLKDLVDEVGKDACRFFFAMRSPGSHLVFDLELAKKQTAENPVYYCQYVHARVCSIFREAGKRGFPASPEALRGAVQAEVRAPSGPSGEALAPRGAALPAEAAFAKEERDLLVKIAWFPETLAACERELSPHPLATYLLELAGLFHPFYEKCRVLDPADRERTAFRLLLIAGVRGTIARGLELLGVSAPESM